MKPPAPPNLNMDDAAQNEINSLKQQVAQLKLQLEVNSKSNGTVDVLIGKPQDSTEGDYKVRYNRLVTLFKKKSESYAEGVYLLTGFKIALSNVS